MPIGLARPEYRSLPPGWTGESKRKIGSKAATQMGAAVGTSANKEITRRGSGDALAVEARRGTSEAGTLVISVAGPASGDSGTRFEYSRPRSELPRSVRKRSPLSAEPAALG